MPAYEFHHVAGFEETSSIGNVYFSNYFLWQGHCRERFLLDHAPSVIEQIQRKEIALFTRRSSCDFEGEWGFAALDEIVVSMRLESFRGGRMTLGFEYHLASEPERLVAHGRQDVYCKARRGSGWVVAPFPVPLVRGLMAFADTDELQASLQETIDFQTGSVESA